jgi:hypothetical protein
MLRKITILLLVCLSVFAYFLLRKDDLHTAIPATPSDNDHLIAEYMSSKDIRHITHMLEAYAKADDEMLKDARRFAHLSSQFKNPKHPRSALFKTASVALAEKYACKSRSTRCTQVMTIASGIWALDSLSAQDAIIRDTVGEFLNGHPTMKKVYEKEGALFSNYLALTVVYIAQPNAVDAMLTAYEQLEPLDMEAVKKGLKKAETNP